MPDQLSTSPPSQSATLPSFQSSNRPVPRLFDEAFLRKLERLAILSRRAMAGQLQGERRSPKRGQSVEFADFRPYAPGDDFRRIDWNAYARLERFFLKLFVEEEDLTVHFLIDSSQSMAWGQPDKLSYAVRAAGALGYVALAGLDRVTATALGAGNGIGQQPAYFPAHRGKQQAFALFEFLMALRAGGQAHLRSSLARYAAAAAQPGPLILVSDLFDTTPTMPDLPAERRRPWADGLNALAARGFEVTVLHVLAPDEVDPAAAPWLDAGPSRDFRLLDSENGAEVEITADPDLLARYRRGVADWQDEIRHFCGARGMHYVPVETSIPIEELVFAWLRHRGVLK